jgi:hypothetical protein
MMATMIAVIFLPGFLVLLTGSRLSNIGWMALYFLALPMWQVILPLYAFWNFDDFSWGETRKVSTEVYSKTACKEDLNAEDDFEKTCKVPLKYWNQYEKDWRLSILNEAHQ